MFCVNYLGSVGSICDPRSQTASAPGAREPRQEGGRGFDPIVPCERSSLIYGKHTS